MKSAYFSVNTIVACHFMKHLSKRILLIFISCLTIFSCRERYDSKLETPDIDDAGMSHGYNLTPLGCLLYHPWAYNDELNSKTYSELQKEIVLHFQEKRNQGSF